MLQRYDSCLPIILVGSTSVDIDDLHKIGTGFVSEAIKPLICPQVDKLLHFVGTRGYTLVQIDHVRLTDMSTTRLFQEIFDAGQ